MNDQRQALFISHATPEDNPFTIWLGAKLAALGYEVWADVMRLRGGDDWQRKLENALRERACKVLLVANPVAVDKQGVRNELQIASDVSRSIGDREFIIPLRLAPFNAPFLIAHAQYIDFTRGWARGLAELLELPEETYKDPRKPEREDDIWRQVQLVHAKEVVQEPETLISNWLPIDGLPANVRLYDFKSGISLGLSKSRMRKAPWPIVEYRRGFISFAPIHDLQDHFGPELPLVLLGEKPTGDFLSNGWEEHEIEFWNARNQYSDLARQALDGLFRSRQLSSFELSDKRLAWWASEASAPTGKVPFKWDTISGLRQIQGASEKRNMKWHYGVTVNARMMPVHHVRVIGRLIFTSDGSTPFDVARMHKLRRSFAKGWRNARWRDMMLAFLSWVADGKPELTALTSSEEGITARIPPMSFFAPVSMPSAIDEVPDDDDPSDDDEPDGFEEIEGEYEPEEDD